MCLAIGHPSRIEILHVLRDGPKCVNDIAFLVDLHQTTVSRHLSILRKSGMVVMQRQGQNVIYSISNPKIVEIIDLMLEVLLTNATRLQRTMSQTAVPDMDEVEAPEIRMKT